MNGIFYGSLTILKDKKYKQVQTSVSFLGNGKSGGELRNNKEYTMKSLILAQDER